MQDTLSLDPSETTVPPTSARVTRSSVGAGLSLRKVSKYYGKAAAALDVDLEIEPGEFVTLLGASGSGKTTTLMMIAGFTEPSSGEILIGGQSVNGLPPSHRNLGVVFQNYSLFPHLTVRQNISFPLEMRGIGKRERERLVRDALDMVRLPEKGDSYPRQLSGGQQQRVALARALVFRPRVMLMDEPLGALDKKLREHMQLEIKRIHSELGATVVYVTHDQEEALTMSDRVAVMQGGRIIQIGRPADLYERPVNRWVADFVGQSNFVEARIVDRNDNDGPTTVALPDGTRAQVCAGTSLAINSVATLVLRPEKLRLSSPDNTGAVENRLAGTVQEVVYLGHATRSVVRLEDGSTIQVQEANRSGSGQHTPGQQVSVHWAPDDGWLLADGGERL